MTGITRGTDDYIPGIYITTVALTEGVCMLQKNFDRPVEWGMIKDYPWSTPQLRKLDVSVCPQPIQSPVMQQWKA